MLIEKYNNDRFSYFEDHTLEMKLVYMPHLVYVDIYGSTDGVGEDNMVRYNYGKDPF